MTSFLKGQYSKTRNASIDYNEPMIFHCHHYNCFLQYSIETGRDHNIDVNAILIDSAQEVVFNQFNHFFKQNSTLTYIEKINIIQEQHRKNGFGLIQFKDDKIVESAINHYVEGWLVKFGKRKESEDGVCFFTAGYIAGALDAISGVLGKHQVIQTKCITKGDSLCQFEISILETPKNLESSVGEGNFQEVEQTNHKSSPVDYIGILDAVSNLPLEGNEKGLISAFGVLLTRMYSNYYALISYRFLNELEKSIGEIGKVLASELLVEAGHVCAFNTFGGIMESAEWAGLIVPSLKTQEDWVHGIVAVVNALGWGKMEIIELISSEKLVLRTYAGYESNMFLAKYSQVNYPIAYLNIGITAGIMNLIYHGDIRQKPELNEDYYHKIFKTAGRFNAIQTKCRTNGENYDEFVATRI